MTVPLKEKILIAIVASIYVVMTLVIAPFSYGLIQFRLSEVLNHLLVYNKKFLLSLALGVFIANFWSPFFLYDIIIGTGTTVVCSTLSIVAFKRLKNNVVKLTFNTLNFSFIGMLPIAMMLTALGESHSFWAIYGTLVLSELTILIIGQSLLLILDKKINLTNLLTNRPT